LKEIEISGLTAYYGERKAVEDVNLTIAATSATAIIGPSGCGKSTLIRCINRMHELVPDARVEGQVVVEGADIYDPSVDPVSLRRSVGMVFQRANPFPTMSIRQNVVSGYRLNGRKTGKDLDEIVEKSLKRAGLFQEVKDRLDKPALDLSGGQQQRLCIARAVAVEPTVLLMDEPASALDPQATLRIEDLIRELIHTYTIVLVTHNMQQAARVADRTVFLLAEEAGGPGRVIEEGPTEQIFRQPDDKRTEDYITGRFG